MNSKPPSLLPYMEMTSQPQFYNGIPAYSRPQPPRHEAGNLAKLWWGNRNPSEDPKHLSFIKKAVLVTGANNGLGYHAALKYAAQGASLSMLDSRKERARQSLYSSNDGSSSRKRNHSLGSGFSTFDATTQFAKRVQSLAGRNFMFFYYLLFGRTAEQGARTLVSATALGPESNGRLWANDILVEQV